MSRVRGRLARVAFAVGLSVAAAFAATHARASADEWVSVRGRVVAYPTHGPIERANVVVRDSVGRELHVATDRDGRYAAIGLTPGPIDVSVESVGLEPDSATCRVSDGDTLRLDFELRKDLRNIARLPRPCPIEPQTADRYVIR